MSTFSEIWFYTKLSTSALTNVLRIMTTEAPVAHQSARHSQRRSAELTCSSSQKPTIVHARFVQHTGNLAASSRLPYPAVSCPPVAIAKQNAPVTSRQASSEGTKLFCAAAFLGEAPSSKYPVELQRSHKTVLKRRSRSSQAGTFSSSRVQTE